MSGKTTSLAVKRRSPERIAGMTVERFQQLSALGQDSLLDFRVTLKGIYDETCRFVDGLIREVREGKNVMPASQFVRWLEFSGVVRMLERFALPGQDFSPLRKKMVDLISECGEQFRGGRVKPKYDASDIAEINRKLDVLLAESARPVKVPISVKRFAREREQHNETNGESGADVLDSLPLAGNGHSRLVAVG